MKNITLILFFLGAFAANSFAARYYVNGTSGSDANTGTSWAQAAAFGSGGAIYLKQAAGTSHPGGLKVTATTMYNNLCNLKGHQVFSDNSVFDGAQLICWNTAQSSGVGEFAGTNGASFSVAHSLVQSADCAAAGITNCINNVYGVDPLFVDAENEDFHIQKCSPAVNTGGIPGVTSTDYEGNTRPYNDGTGKVDIGAYEYQGSNTGCVKANCKNVAVTLNAAGIVSVPAASINNSSTGCASLTLQINNQAEQTFNCSQIGSQIVTLKATDCMNASSVCTATVTINDAMAPAMSCKSATINLDASGQATLPIANINNGSTDNCGITSINLNKTSFSCANVGNNAVTLTASDASGNIASCTATVLVKDVTIPVAKCKNITANLNAAGSFALTPGLVNNGSSDNCSFSMLVTPSTFNCGNVGIQTATLRATDNSGNTATCTAVITVKDVTAPTTVCKNAIVNLDDVGQGTLLMSQVNNNSSDACGIATVTLSKTQFNCSEIPGGAQSVVLTVKDVNNNSASCISQVTVKDIFAPTAICTNTTVSLGTNGSVTVNPSTLASGSFDNCSVWSYSPGAKVYTAANMGNNNLTITVKDWSGNAATCVSVVTVQPYSGFQNGVEDRESAAHSANAFDLWLFPNPVSNDQNVTLEFVLPEAQVFHLELYDLSGRIIKSHEGEGAEGNNSISIPMNEVPSGVYIAGFRSGKLFSRTRLVVQ